MLNTTLAFVFPFHLLRLFQPNQLLSIALTFRTEWERGEPKKHNGKAIFEDFLLVLFLALARTSRQIGHWRENTCHYQLPVVTRNVSMKSHRSKKAQCKMEAKTRRLRNLINFKCLPIAAWSNEWSRWLCPHKLMFICSLLRDKT